MNNIIIFYKLNGERFNIEKLTDNNLKHVNVMMTRRTLEDERKIVGFADSHRTIYDINQYDNKVHDYIFLWTWDNLDEDQHKLIGDKKDK